MRMLRLIAAALAFIGSAAGAAEFDWAPVRETSVVEILTTDADGALRETKIWIVVLGDAGYVRTNDSTWLANIRRGSPVRLRVGGETSDVRASEVADAATKADVEAAFKAKYGTFQRLMSALRMREPSVLRLDPL
jgi:hypothetical protein